MPKPSRLDQDPPDRLGGSDIGSAAEAMQLVVGAWASQLACSLVQLGVPAALAGGPRSAEDLAIALNADGPSLGRVLRAGQFIGLLALDSRCASGYYRL